MIAFLVAMGLVLGQPSTRCHYTNVCAAWGQCDDDPFRPGSGCHVASESSCNYSDDCATFGNCRWRVGKLACYGDDPAMCGSDKSPCMNSGRCKVAKAGDHLCVATRDGCARSRDCQRRGLCGWSASGGGFCEQTKKGCAESLFCKRFGRCGFDAKRRACKHDPKACPGTAGCRVNGTCTSNGGICAYMTDDDCQRGEICTIYGGCHERFYPCDPYSDPSLCAKYSCSARSDEDCAGSVVCKAYGACTRVADPKGDYCAVHPAEAAPCVAAAAPVKEVIASSTYPDWAGYSFAASHLVDDKYWTAWAPDPSAGGNVRLKFVFEREVPIVGLRVGNGFQRIDPTEGILMNAFGTVRGLVVRVGGKPYEVSRITPSAEPQVLRFPPVEASEIEVEIFDGGAGDRFAAPAISLLEPLVCVPASSPPSGASTRPPEAKVRFDAAHVADRDTRTAWVPAPGEARSATLTLTLPRRERVVRVSILAGSMMRDRYTDWWVHFTWLMAVKVTVGEVHELGYSLRRWWTPGDKIQVLVPPTQTDTITIQLLMNTMTLIEDAPAIPEIFIEACAEP